MMKTFRAIVFFVCLIAAILMILSQAAHAQMTTDVLVPSTGSRYVTLGTGLTWGTSGPSGTDNNWLIRVPGSNFYGCIFVTNNHTGNNTATYTAWGTILDSATALAGGTQNSRKWRQMVSTSGNTMPQAGGLSSIPTNTTAIGMFKAHGLTRVAIQIDQTAGGGTADIAVTFTENPFCGDAVWYNPVVSTDQFTSGKVQVTGTQANGQAIPSGDTKPVLIGGATNANLIEMVGVSQLGVAPLQRILTVGGWGNNGAGSMPLNVCDNVARVTTAAGATSVIVVGAALASVRICAMFLTISANGTYTITSGTGVTCGTSTDTFLGPVTLNAATPQYFASPLASMIKGSSGEDLCFSATGGNLEGVISYTRW